MLVLVKTGWKINAVWLGGGRLANAGVVGDRVARDDDVDALQASEYGDVNDVLSLTMMHTVDSSGAVTDNDAYACSGSQAAAFPSEDVLDRVRLLMLFNNIRSLDAPVVRRNVRGRAPTRACVPPRSVRTGEATDPHEPL